MEEKVISEKLRNAARTALTKGVALRDGETILICTDSVLRLIGEAFREEAIALGNETIFLEITPRGENGEDPPPAVTEAMKAVDVVIAPTSKSLTHTPARRSACAAGTRVATLPGITEEIMSRCLAADLTAIAERTVRVAAYLEGSKTIRITSPGGTDIRFSTEGIKPIASTGLIHHAGEFGNMPSGEAYLMPVEGSAGGVFVVDGSMAGLGSLLGKEPLRIRVENGLATDVSGGEEARELVRRLESAGSRSRNIAEFGIGTNDAATITGNILEDEKAMGTVHLALGNNISMGGTDDVGLQLAGLIMNPTVEVDGVVLMKDGTIVETL